MSRINIRLGAEDRTRGAFSAVVGHLKDWTQATVEAAHKGIESFKSRTTAMRDALIWESEAFQKAHKSALSHYETLDEISKRIDGPRQKQEAYNKALERYCALVDRARAAEKARHAKKHNYNAFDPSTHGNLEKLHAKHAKDADPMGIAAAAKGTMAMAKSARLAVPALVMMSNAMSNTTGPAAKMGQAINSVAALTMAFGPLGAVIGGVQAAIDLVANHFIEKANAMLAKVREVGKKVASRLASTKDRNLSGLTSELEQVAEGADRATASFDRMAKAKEMATSARNSIAAAQGEEELIAMKRAQDLALAGAREEEKQRLSAEWKVKIAKRRAELVENTAARERAAEAESLSLAEKRLAVTQRNAEKLDDAADLAYRQHQMIKDVVGDDDRAYVKQFEEAYKLARRRAKAEHDSAANQKMEIEKARQDQKVNDIKRETAIADARRDRDVAEKERMTQKAAAEADMVKKAAAERERLDREAHKRRMDDLHAELRAEIEKDRQVAASRRSIAAAARSEFEKAFAMYRDPSRAAAEIAEEKDYDNDLERLHRDARRYGGSWRIDELSRLMSAGDQQGVRDTIKEWRKNSRFSPEVEAMVRASAAERTQTTVEDELRKIEKNTADLGSKLENLLAMKGGS